ncbi:hypothetical protein NDU88_000664 [Pleurodeles waltl]|uniref:Uncharacterized protein n=1 Tax=Pleurodeles waltl TaxID=8319 RepID=A0AAV7L7I6_PLEWA|nr:hypothetical protein NDU88_000664 [Pleurodeles waltl]
MGKGPFFAFSAWGCCPWSCKSPRGGLAGSGAKVLSVDFGMEELALHGPGVRKGHRNVAVNLDYEGPAV